MKRTAFLFIFLLSVVFYGRAQTLRKTEALQLVLINSDAIGITKEQVSKLSLTAAYTDAGIQYVYLIQTVSGLPVNNQMLVLAFKNNKLISKSGKYNAALENEVLSSSPVKTAEDAVRLAFMAAKVPPPSIGNEAALDDNSGRINYGRLAGVTDNVTAELMWQPVMPSKNLGIMSPLQNRKQEQTAGKTVSNIPSGGPGALEIRELSRMDNLNNKNTGSATRIDVSKFPVDNDNSGGIPSTTANPQQTLRLVWQVQVAPAGSSDNWTIQIDAMTGGLVSKINLAVYETEHDEQDHSDHTAVINHKQSPAHTTARNNFSPPSVTSGVYNVIPLYFESPSLVPFRAVTNPWENAGPGNDATTYGWHYDGTTNHDSTRGNNVFAYLDIESSNAPGPVNRAAVSTTPSPSLSFDFPHDPSQAPGTEGNRNVALTNLFYWNNIVHDVTYQYGFTEPAGNFQNDNMGRGGRANDYMRAEAQDASGTNNATYNGAFRDGTAPRIQMFLFTPGPVVQKFTVNDPSVIAGDYVFAESNFSTANKLVNTGPVTAQVVYFKDANGTTNEACSGRPANELDGKIALIKRGSGSCSYTAKVKQAQDAGAVAVIIINNTAGAPVVMTGSDNSIFIPAVMISDADGAKLAAQLDNNVNVTLSAVQLPDRDGDLSSGVIIHEYAHGVSSRLTGGPVKPSSCLSNAEQGGEGWSDYFNLMLTTDWSKATVNDGAIPRVMGAYVSGDPAGGGIREVPYTTDMSINPLTYSHVQAANGQQHRIGTLWCSALWDMTWGIIKQENSIATDLYKFDLANTGGNMIAFKLVHEGLRLQNCRPGFLDARDAIIQADINLYNGRHACTIWEAFARRGMGFNAVQGSSDEINDQVQNFDMPGPAKFTAQPADASICIGGTATFSPAILVPSALTYQWQKSSDGGSTWTDIAGATSAAYTTPAAVAADSGSKYRLNVTSAAGCNAGTITSQAATLFVLANPVGGTLSPAIDGSCAEPDATGTLTLSGYSGNIIRWERSTNGTTWIAIPNTTTTTFNYSVTANTMYRVLVQGSGCAAEAYSSTASITVNPSALPLSIVPDPPAGICIGEPVKLTVMEGKVSSISTGRVTGSNASLAAGVTFNFRNNNNYAVVITDISSAINVENATNVQVYYNLSEITTRPTAISNATGWKRLFAGNVSVSGYYSVNTLATGLNLVVPANTTYGIYIESTGDNAASNLAFRTTTSATPVATSVANCEIITGGDVSIATGSKAPTSNIGAERALFRGIVRFKAADVPVTTGTFNWTPATGLSSTTTPVVAASPMVSTAYTVTHDDGAGCIRKISTLVTVNTRPAITTQPVNTRACENSDATFSVRATGSDLTYTWEQSTDNCATYTPVNGATAATLRLSSVNRNMNGYSYRCKITGACTPVIYTNCVTLKVDTLPPALSVSPQGTICGGQAGTNGILLKMNVDAQQEPAVTTATFSSSASVAVPDNSATGATSVITVSGIPANATVTKITVTLNMSHTYPGELVINLKGPNLPAITNLYKFNTGTGTGNASGVSTWGWYGAQIADGGTEFKTVAAAPYIYGASPVWAPDGLITNIGSSAIQNPAGFVANASTLRALYGADPNGDWTLALADTGPNDVGTLSGWSVKIEYSDNPNGITSYTWAPAAGLYMDDKATIPYITGTSATAVYAAPAAATTYNATALFTGTGCASKAQVIVVNTPAPFVTQFESPVCLGDTVRIINRTPGAATAMWSPATELYTDASATIPYMAGMLKDTLWAKPITTPATYTISMNSEVEPMALTMNNPVSTLAGVATFNIRNNNLFPVILNEIAAPSFEGASADVQLWYKTSAINGPVGEISNTNGWTLLGSATITPAGDYSIQPFLTGLSLSIPANTTYGFAISADQSGNNRLLISSSGNSIVSGGSVDLISGRDVTFAGINPPPAEPAFGGFYFVGSVKITPVISSTCTGEKAITLAIHSPANITTQPVSASVCTDKAVSFTTVTTGSSLMHQWRVSTNGGTTWTDVVNNTLYSGAKTGTLTITAPPLSMAGYQYKDSVTTPLCGGIVSDAATLLVTGLPAPQLTASDLLITPGQTATITATSTPAAAANGWTWTLNGVAITGNGNTQNVNVDQAGVYQASVTDVNGCSALSNELVIGAEGSDKLWIYPNPSQGQFQVRLYFNNMRISERRVVTIYDMLGQKVASQEFTLTNLTPAYMDMRFDLSKMAAGTYMVKVTDRFSAKTASGLLVIQH